MNTYRYIIGCLAICLLPLWASAQNPQVFKANQHKLNSSLNGNLHYIASDYVHCFVECGNMSFSYLNPSATESFHAEIDPFLIVPPDEEPGGPGGVVGNDGMVGSLPGSFNVSGIGAATYTIPIEVPAGRAGVTPNISLNYNSMGGNGPLGIGWSIGGLSSISRTGTNYYNDNPTEDEDWRPDPVDFDEQDRFMLDGQRLVLLDPVNDTYGSDETTEYRTEQESFTRIISYGESGKNGPQYFLAWTKDGKKIEYGRTGNSAMQASGRTDDAVLTWMVNKISDRWGNYMEFEYEQFNSYDIRIKKINYTAKENSQLTAFYEMVFDYSFETADERVQYTYINGSKLAANKYFLDNIRVNYIPSGDQIKKYELIYDKNELWTKLQSVQLYGMNDNKLPKTVFEWREDSEDIDKHTTQIDKTITFPSGAISNLGMKRAGDFNGDGRTDLAVFYGETDNYGKFSCQKILVYEFDNTGSAILAHSLTLPNNMYIITKNVLTGDFTDDGKEDIMFFFYIFNNSYGYTHLKPMVLVSNGTGINISLSTPKDIAGLDNEPFPLDNGKYVYRFYNTDVDGDAQMDLVCILHHSGNPDLVRLMRIWKIDYSSQGTFSSAVYSTIYLTDKYNYESVYDEKESDFWIFDFNGDGCSDFVGCNESGLEVMPIMKGQHDFSNTQITPVFSSSYPNYEDYSKFSWGDFNGDRQIDLLVYYHNSSYPNWSLLYNTGTDWELGVSPVTTIIAPVTLFSYPEAKEHYHYTCSDFNADGFMDIVEIKPESLFGIFDKDYIVNIYYSNGGSGSGFTTKTTSHHFTNYPNKEIFESRGFWDIIDLNGDGSSDLLFDNYNQDGPEYNNFNNWLLNKTEYAHLIDKITPALGSSYEISYQALSYDDPDNTDYYLQGTQLDFPFKRVTTSLLAVSQVSSNSWSGSSETKNYQYQGLTVHLQGKGLLGYQKQTVYDVATNIESKTIFSLDCGSSGIILNYPKESIQMLRGGTHYLSYSGYTPEFHVYNGDTKRFFMYNKKTHAKKWDWDGDRIATTRNEMEFDTDGLIYGAPSYTISAQDDRDANASFNIENFKFIQRKDFTYETPILTSGNSPAWIIGQPKAVKTTWKADGQSDIERVTAFEYYNDPSAGNYRALKVKINEPGDGTTPNELETRIEYEYDPYGNIITTTEKAPNYNPSEPLVRIEEFEYLDNDKRFLSRKSKLIGNYTFYYGFGYNEVTGLLTSESDCNGLIKNYEYDGFGRPKETTYTYLDDGDYDEVIYGRESTALRWTGSHEFEPDNNTSLYYSWSKSSGNPEEYVFYDEFGKKLREVYHGLEDNTWIYHDYKYDDRGRLEYDYEPYYSTASAGNYTFYVYDDLDRPVTITHADGTTTAYEYDARTTTVTHAGQSHTKEVNAAGWDYQSTDNDDNTVEYAHYSDGKVKETFLVSDETNTKMTFTYDIYGNRLTMDDPSLGTVTSTYNPFGEMLTNTDQKGQLTTYEYDDLGRTVYKKLVDDQNRITEWTYTYDDVVNKPLTLGMLSHVVKSGQDPHSLDYQYDRTGNVITETENILNGAEDYILSYTYDTYGRLKTCSYPTGLNIRYAYKNGYNTDILDDNHFKSIWHLNELNAMGQTKSYKLGNQLKTDFTYDGSHLPETIKTSLLSDPTYHLQNLEYQWTDEKNLDWKKDFMFPQDAQDYYYYYEYYQYDDLNRLTYIGSNVSTNTGSMTYHANGNIKYKTGLGQYTYDQSGNAGPYAVTATESGGCDQRILYTGFDKIERISSDVYGDNIDDIGIDYGIDNQRIHQICYSDHSTVEEKTYIFGGMVERIQRGSETHYLSYISSPDALVAMHISDDAGRDEMKYVLTDYLGTIYALVDDGAQSTDDALYYSFNAWGERRELQAYDGSLAAPLFSDPADYITSRGYTGHEHIDAFDLINMNGRAYDPLVGAFLSPDPYVQAPDMPQNLNRYAYCLNNPLKYSDPSGEFIHLIAGAVLGGFMNWMMGGCQFNLDGLAQFGIGAIAGAAGAGVGVGIKTASAGASFWAGFVGSPMGINTILQVGYTSSFFNGAISGAGAGFTSGSISGFGNGIVQGDSFGDALSNGLKVGAWSAAIAGINGGISEGLEARANHKNFLTGKDIEEVAVFNSPVSDNFGKKNGECAFRCFEEFSESYGLSEYNFDYWVNKYNQPGSGVHPSKVVSLANSSGVFSAEPIAPDVGKIARAIANGNRVMMGFNPEGGGSHAVMVQKVKIWRNSYRIWFAETSPVRLAPYSTSKIFDINGAAFWKFFKK